MQWDHKAQTRLSKVPFFVRKKVRKQVEVYVTDQGRNVVTDADVSAVKQRFIMPTAEEIEKLEQAVERGNIMEGLDTKYYMIKVCGGAAGCPLSVIEDKKIAHMMLEVIEETNLVDYMAAGIEEGRPSLSHHKFKMGIAGCPNGCSEPHIKDFAVIGQLFPVVGSDGCTGCGICLKSCRENALKLSSRKIKVDYDRCLGCGNCIEACSKGVFAGREGYKIIVGGRLGRHPRLAETLGVVDTQEELRMVFKNSLELFKAKRKQGQRFSHLVESLGIEEVRRLVLE